MAIIEGALSGNLLEVDAEHRGMINMPTTASYAGYVSLLAEHDGGSVTGVKDVKALDISEDYRLRVGTDTLMFNEWFSGSTLNTTLWNSTDGGATSASVQGGGFLVLNASGSAGLSMQSRVQSYKAFPIYGTFGMYAEFNVQFPYAPQTNNVCEWGLGYASGSIAPTEGVFFRIDAAGELRGVISYKGTEDQSAVLNFTNLIGVNRTVHTIIHVTEDAAEFWIDDIMVSRRPRPTDQASMAATGNLPILMRCCNSGITTYAQQLKVSMVNVTMADMLNNKPWQQIITGMGGHASQGQTGGILGSTAGLTNNQTAVTTALMTNTTAALGTGLGGQFTANMNIGFPSGSSCIDGIICSYQVPAGNTVRSGKTLYITGVDIFSAVAGSVVATGSLVGGPVLLAYTLAYGNTAVSLVTTQTATTKAAIRVPLGFQSFAANAPSGTIAAQTISQDFSTPIVVNQSEFVAISVKNMSMALVTAGTITFMIRFSGYWE
jgi:hypothetical protein